MIFWQKFVTFDGFSWYFYLLAQVNLLGFSKGHPQIREVTNKVIFHHVVWILLHFSQGMRSKLRINFVISRDLDQHIPPQVIMATLRLSQRLQFRFCNCYQRNLLNPRSCTRGIRNVGKRWLIPCPCHINSTFWSQWLLDDNFMVLNFVSGECFSYHKEIFDLTHLKRPIIKTARNA